MQKHTHARTQIRARRILTVALAVLALGAGALPTAMAGPVDPPPMPASSVWGKDAPKLPIPPVKVGTNKAVAPQPEAAPSKDRAAWRAAQKQRAQSSQKARLAAPAAPLLAEAPKGQGAVPWHRISDFRITDSLVARVNYSTGNLMLAGTDFDVPGVGQSLQLTRTYNSMDAPWGKVSQRWWQGWERYAQITDTEFVWFDSTGASVSFVKKADGTYTTPAGYSKDLTKNADGTYTLTDRKSGSKDTYNAGGTLTKVTDRNNATITVTQHDAGTEHKGFKLTETRSGRFVDLVKTDASQWQAKDHTGRTAVFDLNPAGDLARTTDTAGKSTAFEYDSSRRLTRITTPDGRVTNFGYDAQNRVTSMQRATAYNGNAHTGPTHTYAYEAGKTKVTDPEQHTTTYELNADGGVTKTTDALGHSRSSTYDANHNVKTATDAMGVGTTPGNETAYGWDARNNPTSAKLPTGATSAVGGYATRAGRDVPGTMESADGEKTSFTYDAAGNTESVAVSGTGGGTEKFTYNKATPTCGGFEGQRCTVTDARGKVTKFQYDAKGNLIEVTPPAPLGKTTYTYDALGRVETSVDGRGVNSVFTYDNRDRITEVSSSTTTVRYVYDGDGNLSQRTDDAGLIKYAFDPLSRETIRTLQNGSQTELTYTPAGNVDTYKDPAGLTDYTYDAANRLTALKDPSGKTTTYTYNANDVRTKTTYPGGTVQEVTPDKSGRPTLIKATSPKGTLTNTSYTYSYVSGTATKDGMKVRTATDGVMGLKKTYEYDSAGRFSYSEEMKGTTLAGSYQYCYDAAGNLTSQGSTKGCPSGIALAYNDASQLISRAGSTAGWGYDKAGNETDGASGAERTRTGGIWSDHSQQTSVTVAGKKYTGLYGSTDQSERLFYGDTTLHNGPLGLAGKTDPTGDMRFNREASGTLNSMTTGGKSYYYLTDALGSVLAMADETGTKVNEYRYSPRGVDGTFTEKVPQPYRFAGGYQDPTGLYHLKARYYDPRIGRFTSPDPSGQEKNPYLYAEGDPVNRIDPNGLDSWSIEAEICFIGCISGSYTRNDDGSTKGGIGLGVGSPGSGVSVGRSSGEAESGLSSEYSCGIGTVDYSWSPEDNSFGAATGGKTGYCSAMTKWQYGG
ncbi:RHS repeat-associated core domain-containing protein [Streptomyces candidus]|uniref:RHS repeat-associated protein n=3 Tax=Streptomyces candidus TaxID=67283 RepID=A0A7X0HJH9_9ACTN|nr:RHS repeat-associated protein [Streptomyces candidus]